MSTCLTKASISISSVRLSFGFRVDIVLFGLFLEVFKMRLLERGFHTPIKDISFSSPNDVGSHNPPQFGAQRPHWHSFLSPIDVGPLPNPPPSRPSVLAGTLPHVHPLRGSASSLAYCPVSGSDTICNNPPLADIVLFGLPLKVFKTRLLGRGFHTLIKGVLLPN